MPKRLVVCCDGTWNTPDQVDQGMPTQTNVTKVALAVALRDGNGVEQRVFYHKGVGTAAFDHWRGGALGSGLSKNVQDAYMFLVENYDPSDDIFLFGFSRGAYTARSTAGLVRNSGLLKRQYAGKLDEAYKLYRDRSKASHPTAVEAQLFRKSFSLEVRIKFIGVWDTVGALGIPVAGPGVQLINDHWKFHDVKLSSYVDNAFQALAIDEHRKPFTSSIWEQQPHAVNQTLEQVWFAGVHSNVGGGYADTGLSDIALLWMARKAQGYGLALDFAAANVAVGPDPRGTLRDSMTWYYKRLGELVRPIGAPRVDDESGQPVVTQESVADKAEARWKGDPNYRPDNLRNYLNQGGTITPV